MSSCFSRCLRVPIAIRAFYESYLWILQTLLLTHPDLHPALLGSYRVWQRERIAKQAQVTELQCQIDQLQQVVERISTQGGAEHVWAELLGDTGKQYTAQLKLTLKDIRVMERAVPVGRLVTDYELSPMSGMVVEDGNYALSFEVDGKQHKDRVQIRNGKLFAR